MIIAYRQYFETIIFNLQYKIIKWYSKIRKFANTYFNCQFYKTNLADYFQLFLNLRGYEK
jgi:hypothetical protein